MNAHVDVRPPVLAEPHRVFDAYLMKAIGRHAIEDAFKLILEWIGPAMGVIPRRRGRRRSPDAYAALAIQYRTGKRWSAISQQFMLPCKDRDCPLYCSVCGDVKRRDPPSPGVTRKTKEKCEECGYPIRSPEEREAVCYKHSDPLRKSARDLEVFLRQCDLLEKEHVNWVFHGYDPSAPPTPCTRCLQRMKTALP